MENTIFVQNLSLFGIHGKDAITKGEKREFIFSIDVTIADISRAVQTKKLADTFDYKEIITAAKEIIEGPPHTLIESVASAIAEKILRNKKAKKIKLTLSKRELLSGAMSGISIVRSKPDF